MLVPLLFYYLCRNQINTDDNLPPRKSLIMHNFVILIKSVFNKYHKQRFAV